MTANTILLKGKYLGQTFEEVLNKDLNYCNFIVDMRFPSADFKEFQDWLKVNIHDARKAHVAKLAEKLNKQHC